MKDATATTHASGRCRRAGARPSPRCRSERRPSAEIVERIRRALDPRAKTLGDIPPFDLEAAHELYRLLLEPVRTAWADADSLLIVSDGVLGQVPFSILPTARVVLGADRAGLFSSYREVPWLIRRHAITTLPSASALATLRGLPAPRPGRRPFIGFGDPYFNDDQAGEQRPTARAGLPDQGGPVTRAYAHPIFWAPFALVGDGG